MATSIEVRRQGALLALFCEVPWDTINDAVREADGEDVVVVAALESEEDIGGLVTAMQIASNEALRELRHEEPEEASDGQPE